MLKKIFFASLAFTSHFFAYYECSQENPCPQEDPCDKCKPCKPCIPCDACPPFQPKNPPKACGFSAPYRYSIACPNGVNITASFLWWEAKMDNLQYGDIETNVFGSAVEIETSAIERLQPDFQYKYGYKVGLGYDFLCDAWDVYAEYTSLCSSVKRKTSVQDVAFSGDATFATETFINGYFFTNSEENSFLLGNNDNFFPYFASAKWSVDLDMVDLELGRKSYVGRCFTLRPFSSLRMVFLEQTYVLQYNGNTGSDSEQAFTDPTGNFTFNTTNKTTSWAIGPRFGMDFSWILCNGFSLFSDFSTSLVFTKYSTLITNSDYQLFDDTDASVYQSQKSIKEKTDSCVLRPIADFTIGLSWGQPLNCHKWFFDMKIGYSFSVFWDQNMLYQTSKQRVRDSDGTVLDKGNTITQINGGNLYYQGLTVSAIIYF